MLLFSGCSMLLLNLSQFFSAHRPNTVVGCAVVVVAQFLAEKNLLGQKKFLLFCTLNSEMPVCSIMPTFALGHEMRKDA